MIEFFKSLKFLFSTNKISEFKVTFLLEKIKINHKKKTKKVPQVSFLKGQPCQMQSDLLKHQNTCTC